MSSNLNRPVAIWLLICSAMVFCTLVVGGVTRLTHSGLSIVEWQPLLGTIPPLSADDWNLVFAKYQQTPEYLKVNHQMALDEFKGIFWWEYAHRLIGRLIGIVFALPFIWFLARRQISMAMAPRLAGIFVLGALQGAMGWYMVKSGLVDDPRVSQYRLTAHLSLAFLIFAAMIWMALGLIQPRITATQNAARRRLQKLSLALLALVAYMVVTGGFVAGIRAGKAYNSFPLMNGYLVPPELFMIEPWYLNFFNNMATVQFDHRLGAWALAFFVPWLVWQLHRIATSPRIRLAAKLLLAAVAAQISLGIATLLQAVPVGLGATHQAGSMVVFAVVLWLNHELRVASSDVP